MAEKIESSGLAEARVVRRSYSGSRSSGAVVGFVGLSVFLLLIMGVLGAGGGMAPAPRPTSPSSGSSVLVPGAVIFCCGGGYGILTNNSSSVSSVYTAWIQPSITCNSSTGRGADQQDLLVASGIGTYPNILTWNHHLSIGVWALCPRGAATPVYYGAYTHEPGSICPVGVVADACIIPNFAVAPGDRMVSAVYWNAATPNRVFSTLVDRTLGEVHSNVFTIGGFHPIDGVCAAGHFWDMALFKDVKVHCWLTVDGATGGVGSFHPPNTLDIIQDPNGHGQKLSKVTPLSGKGTTFTVSWVRSEPS